MKYLNKQTFVFFLLFCVEHIFSNSISNDDDLYVITASNGLVLDGTNSSRISVEYYTGFTTQLWNFKDASRPGLYYIINNYTGLALDFVHGEYPQLVANERSDNLKQQWIISRDGSIITNAAKQWNMDVHNAALVAGQDVGLWENNGCNCQKFVLHKKV